MLILHITTTDPAGAAYNLVRATNEHTQHRARLLTTTRLPEFDFPCDIADIFDGGDELEALLNEADVFHFHKIQEDYVFGFDFSRGRREFDIEKYAKGKKIVYHIHGHPSERNFFKENAEMYAKKGRPVLASTPDLEEIYKPFCPTVRYFPNCVPTNDVRYLPRQTDAPITGADGTTQLYCVFQSGTNSVMKNMHVIREVMDKLCKELPVFFLHTSPEFIQTQDTVLRHKRIAHIMFDHIEGYYGLSSLEGLSMGKPVIAGLSDYSMDAIKKFFFDGIQAERFPALPWLIAREAEGIEKSIRLLINDKDYRKQAGLYSRHFMETVWSEQNIAERLAGIYESL